jgi:hypothetical protein
VLKVFDSPYSFCVESLKCVESCDTPSSNRERDQEREGDRERESERERARERERERERERAREREREPDQGSRAPPPRGTSSSRSPRGPRTSPYIYAYIYIYIYTTLPIITIFSSISRCNTALPTKSWRQSHMSFFERNAKAN